MDLKRQAVLAADGIETKRLLEIAANVNYDRELDESYADGFVDAVYRDLNLNPDVDSDLFWEVFYALWNRTELILKKKQAVKTIKNIVGGNYKVGIRFLWLDSFEHVEVLEMDNIQKNILYKLLDDNKISVYAILLSDQVLNIKWDEV